MRPQSLLVTLKSLIERSYGLPPVICDLAPFIVGDRGFRTLYPQTPGDGAQVVVRKVGDALRAALYYPDALVRHLERFNPLRGIGDDNIDQFAVLVEELDHLLVIASRAAVGRPSTLLELEYHAGVTKYLVVMHFLGRQTGRRRLAEAHRRWARHHLFEKYDTGDGESAARYRSAAVLAERYVRYLERLSVPRRLEELRALERRPFAETCRLLGGQP